MRTRAALILLSLLASANPASAQSIDFVGSVAAPFRTGLPKRPIGDPRYVALSTMYYEGADGVRADVLDLMGLNVAQVTTTRAELLRHFGRHDPTLGYSIPPSGRLVSYEPGRAG